MTDEPEVLPYNPSGPTPESIPDSPEDPESVKALVQCLRDQASFLNSRIGALKESNGRLQQVIDQNTVTLKTNSTLKKHYSNLLSEVLGKIDAHEPIYPRNRTRS